MTFADSPGFEALRTADALASTLPTTAERQLLERHRPNLFLPDDHPGPVSFYEDYIAQGTLFSPAGERISSTVDRSLLNRHRDISRTLFRHDPRAVPPKPVAFGRIRYDHIDLPARGRLDLTFLTYHFVFRHSGLPAGLPPILWALARVFNAHMDWHQLDHYTAVTIVLGPENQPFALLLQQHNYMRSYLFGKDLPMPTDGRPEITAAIGSNELYPHSPERRRHRAVPFIGAKTVEYLVMGTARPRLQADDITHGQSAVSYRLECLPPNDAFYTFRGWLGARRRLPGRTGPPGADYNTIPAFKPMGIQLMAFYWHHGHYEYVDLVRAGLFHGPRKGFRDSIDATTYTSIARRFERALPQRLA
ncbi:MAG: hypothetical protein ACTSX7_03385 [Alphaproteobacteria bacterium]